MVRSWVAMGEGGWGRKHSAMRGLGTAEAAVDVVSMRPLSPGPASVSTVHVLRELANPILLTRQPKNPEKSTDV